MAIFIFQNGILGLIANGALGSQTISSTCFSIQTRQLHSNETMEYIRIVCQYVVWNLEAWKLGSSDVHDESLELDLELDLEHYCASIRFMAWDLTFWNWAIVCMNEAN